MEVDVTVRRTRNEIGAMGEALAALELEKQGLEILDRNWSCRWGELDVVALDRSDGRRTAVFCEVKCRTGRNYGDPLESITRAKVRRLRQLAAEWMSQHSTAGRRDAAGRHRGAAAARPEAGARARHRDRGPMSLACAYAVALVGLDGRIVEVEAHTGPGLPRTILVGLPDTSLYEARDRCKAAVHSSQQSWPNTLLTINLSPATLPKQGSGYDLAIVTAVLAAADVVKAVELRDTVLLGELGLDGRVRPVRGVLPATLAAAQAGFRRVIVPYRQAGEAQLVDGIEVLGVASLAQLIAVLQHEPVPDADPVDLAPTTQRIGTDLALDLADVAGQLEAKWAVEVAAAGRHHLLFTGPPGVGKTMIAARLPGLLPDLTIGEALEVSAVHSLAGFDLSDGLVRRPPYAEPHHSASMASIVGGGPGLARPGAVSCAHRGVLFLDEAPEFSVKVLEALRVPLESGVINLNRSHGLTRYPAQVPAGDGRQPLPVWPVGIWSGHRVCARRWRSGATQRSCRHRSATGWTSPSTSGP